MLKLCIHIFPNHPGKVTSYFFLTQPKVPFKKVKVQLILHVPSPVSQNIQPCSWGRRASLWLSARRNYQDLFVRVKSSKHLHLQFLNRHFEEQICGTPLLPNFDHLQLATNVLGNDQLLMEVAVIRGLKYYDDHPWWQSMEPVQELGQKGFGFVRHTHLLPFFCLLQKSTSRTKETCRKVFTFNLMLFSV